MIKVGVKVSARVRVRVRGDGAQREGQRYDAKWWV